MIPPLLTTYLRGIQPIIYVRTDDPQGLFEDLRTLVANNARVHQCDHLKQALERHSERLAQMNSWRLHILLVPDTLTAEAVKQVAHFKEDIHFADILILTGAAPAREAIPVELRYAVSPVDTEVPPHAADVPRVDPADVMTVLAATKAEQLRFEDPLESLIPALQGLSRIEMHSALCHMVVRGIAEHRDRKHFHLEYAQEYRTRWERV